MSDVRPPLSEHESAGERSVRLELAWEEAKRLYARSLLTLSVGSLVVSIAFLGKRKASNGAEFLEAAWVAFAISIVATVIALLVDWLHHPPRLVAAELQRTMRYEGAAHFDSRAARLEGALDLCMIAAGVSFAAGVLCLLVFALCNPPGIANARQIIGAIAWTVLGIAYATYWSRRLLRRTLRRPSGSPGPRREEEDEGRPVR